MIIFSFQVKIIVIIRVIDTVPVTVDSSDVY